MNRSLPDPAAVFSRLGLRSESLVRSVRPQTDVLSVRLAQALAELGGVYLAFGVFLQYRSDLVTSGQIEALSGLSVEVPQCSRQQVAEILGREAGANGATLAATLSDQPEWTTLNRTAFRGRVGDQTVLVEVAHSPVTEGELAAFTKGLRLLGVPEFAPLRSRAIQQQFAEWLRAGEDLQTERNFLDAISQYGGDTAAKYPRLVSHLCGPNVLVWPSVDGQSAKDLVASGDVEICGLIAGAIFEQFCTLGMVECDLRLDAMVVTGEKKLAFRRMSRPAATPPGLTAAALEYVAAGISRDAALSSRALLRLAISYESPLLEKQLISQLSAVDPELKVHRWFPASAETFEANWRAISRLGVGRTLFLDCLHRNLVATGYWISDTVRAGAPACDVMADAQWPVLARILRGRFAEITNAETAMQWVASGGLLALGMMKEASRLAGEIRDNRLSMGFDISTAPTRTESTRPSWLLPAGVALLAVFLVCLRWGGLVPPGFMLPVQGITLAALVGLFWVVLRIR